MKLGGVFSFNSIVSESKRLVRIEKTRMVHPCELLKLTGQASFLGQAPTRWRNLWKCWIRCFTSSHPAVAGTVICPSEPWQGNWTKDRSQLSLDFAPSWNLCEKRNSWSEAYDCPRFLPGDTFQSTVQQECKTSRTWPPCRVGIGDRGWRWENWRSRVDRGGHGTEKAGGLQTSLLGAFAEFRVSHT